MMKQKRAYVRDVLRANPARGMTAQETALQCSGGRYTRSRDAANILTGEARIVRTNSESMPGRILLAYRYAKGGNA